jgi:hypothetical protein
MTNDPMELDAQTAIAEAMANQLSEDPDQRALITEGWRLLFRRGAHDPETCKACRSEQRRFLNLKEDDGSVTVLDMAHIACNAIALRYGHGYTAIITSSSLDASVSEYKQFWPQFHIEEGTVYLCGPASDYLRSYMQDIGIPVFHPEKRSDAPSAESGNPKATR